MNEVPAQVVSKNIIVTVSEVPNSSSFMVGDDFTAELSYSVSELKGVGEESLLLSDSRLSVRFDFYGTVYDEHSDPADGFPMLFFSDSELVGIDYWNSSGIEGGGENTFFRFFKDQSFNYSTDGVSEYSGDYRVSAVPEPSHTALLGMFGLFIILTRNR